MLFHKSGLEMKSRREGAVHHLQAYFESRANPGQG